MEQGSEMDLQNLKRWHWVVISLVVGLTLSYLYSKWDISASAPTKGIHDLQRELLHVEHRAEGDPPRIRNLTLYPPTLDRAGKPTWLLTFDYLDVPRRSYVPYQVTVGEPFLVEFSNNTQFAEREYVPNIRVYLDAVKAANEQLDYRYVWWREPVWTYTLWTGGAVLLIGGVWPTILNLLVGAGYGRPPRQEEDYDLSRFGRGKPELAAAAATPEMDSEELDAVTRAYEARLGESADAESDEAPDTADAPSTEIRQLKAEPLPEDVPPLRPQEEEDKEFVGEFYPVARPVHKKEK